MKTRRAVRKKTPAVKRVVHGERTLIAQIMETSPAGITMVNRKGKVTFANRQAEKVLGLTKDKISERAYNDPIWHITDYQGNAFPEDKLPFHQVMSTGQPVHNVCHAIERSDGQRILLSINAAPLFNKSKQVNGMVATIEDVTDRVRAKVAVQESEERLHRLSDITVEGIVIHEKGVILDANQALATMFGYELSEIIGQYALKFFTPESGKVMMHNIMKEYEKPYEAMGIKKDGSIFPVEIIGKSTTYMGRNVRVGSVQDITERKRSEKALRESEETLKFSQQVAHVGHWTWDTTTNQVQWSDEMYRIFGLSPEKFSGDLNKIIMETIHPDDKAKVIQSNNLVLERQQPAPLEYRVVWPDQSVRTVLAVPGASVSDGSGKILKLIGIVQDITDRKQAEEALKASEEKYKAIIETTSEWIWDIDVHGKHTYSNQSIESILGYTIAEFLGTPALNFMEAEDRDKIKNRLPELIASKKGWRNWIIRWVHKNGTIRYLESNANPIFDSNGILLGYRGSDRDITDRIKAEELLHRSEEKYRSLAESISDWIWEVDINGCYTYSNPKVYDIIGYKIEEVIGKTPFEFMKPGEAKRTVQQFKQATSTGQPFSGLENINLHKDGHEVVLETSGTPIFDAEHKLIGYRGIDRDISQRKLAIKTLLESEARYRTIVENINDALYIHDFQGNIIDVNENACKMLGYTKEELVGAHLGKIDSTENKKYLPERMEKLLGENSIVFEGQHVKKDGSLVPVEISAKMVTREGKGIIQGFARDITERKRAEEAIKQVTREWQTTFDAASDAICLLDQNQKILRFNRAMYQLFPNAADQMIGQHCWKIVHGTSKPIEECPIMRMIKTHHRESMELQKEDKWYEVTVDPILDNLGSLLGAVHIVRDITERKHAEELLRVRMKLMEFSATHSLEELLQKTLDEVDRLTNSPIGFYHFVESDQKTLLLQAWSTRTVQEFCKAEGKGMHYNIDEAGVWVDCVRQRRPVIHNDYASLPHRKGMPEGHAKVIRELVVPILRGDRIVAILGVGNKPSDYVQKDIELISYLADVAWEITQRKHAEEALKESEEKFRSLAEQSPNMIFINKKGRVVYANVKCEEITGYTKEEFYTPDFDFLKITSPDFVEFVKEKYSLHQRGEEVQPYEYALVTKHGKRINAIIATKLIDYENDKAILGVITDITDRKRMEEEKEKLQSDLLQVQKMDAIGQLAGGIAHDFNNMIGVILGYAVLIEKQLDPSNPLHQKVKAIITAAERSANLTKQLLGFARKQITNPIVLNMNDELLSLEKMLHRLIGEDIDLRIIPSKDLWNTKIDPVQIDQILTNFATNARDAIENVGVITIETSNVSFDPSFSGKNPEIVPGEYVMLVFSDTGKGMDRATQEHIFEPFYTTKPKGSGVGLGLATVFGIVKQNNGYINVYSEPNQGTTLKIYLPRHYGEAETPLTAQEELSLVGIETILVVEDEEQLLQLTISSLKNFGYTVLGAKSPREAISLCQHTDQKIDLLLTDVVMPEMNGKELKEKLNVIKPGMKTIFMSGYTANIVANRGVLEEGLQFLQKPFAPATLAKKVRNVLNG